MLRTLSAALLLAASIFAFPAYADGADDVCITSEAMMARAAELEYVVFTTLHSVDIGDEDKAEVVVFEVNEGVPPYVAVAFEGGCFAGLRQMDQNQVEQLINENTKKI